MDNQALCSNDALDIFFDVDEGILSRDSFYSNDFEGLGDFSEIQDPTDMLQVDISPDEFSSEGLFSVMENSDLLRELTEGAISPDEMYARSPINSDSGISDNQGSPFSYDSQSLPSPPTTKQEDITLDLVFIQTEDVSNALVGEDAMLAEEPLMSASSNDSASESEFVMHNYSASAKIKEFLPLMQKDVVTDNTKVTEKYPPLLLTPEENKLLNEMNVVLPSHLPLTRSEERSLKTVRRKIRNKASAQESRRKKKIYIDGLEDRVTVCTKQNVTLQKKMEKLEKENMSLLFQLKKFQAMVTGGNKPAQASTCVMVLLLSFTLFIAPSFNPFESKKSLPVESYQPAGVISRTLQSVQGYESVMNVGVGAGFTPAKAHHVDSFFSQDDAASEPLDTDGTIIEEQLQKLNTDEETRTMEPEDLQTIYNTSELESDDKGVYDGGRIGRKLVLNDEM